MNKLKNHPFGVEAFFENSTVLTFSAHADELQKFLPERLELDLHNERFGFVAAAIVDTKNLRPAGFPAFLGRDFFLVGFRIFVKYTTSKGKRLRGLYIIKSETNKRFMKIMGNTFTHYNYTFTDISKKENDAILDFRSIKSKFHVTINKNAEPPALPVNSPFKDWKEARRFAGPLPFTFTYDQQSDEMLIIQGMRTNWKPKPVQIADYKFQFLDDLKVADMQLANAFQITAVPYKWIKGKIDKW